MRCFQDAPCLAALVLKRIPLNAPGTSSKDEAPQLLPFAEQSLCSVQWTVIALRWWPVRLCALQSSLLLPISWVFYWWKLVTLLPVGGKRAGSHFGACWRCIPEFCRLFVVSVRIAWSAHLEGSGLRTLLPKILEALNPCPLPLILNNISM